MPCNDGYTTLTGVPQPFTLDLGAVYNVTGLALWDGSSNGVAIGTNFVLYADVDNIFGNSNETALGFFSTTPVAALSGFATIFSVSASTQYFHLQLIPSAVGIRRSIGEVAVRVDSAVPEPGSLSLAGLSLVLMGAAWRKRSQPLSKTDSHASGAVFGAPWGREKGRLKHYPLQ